MQTARLLQAVALMLIVALAASCAATKEYTSKLFAPRDPVEKQPDSSGLTLRFLDLDKVEPNQEDWVTTDIIMGRDSSHSTFALDNFAKDFPASPLKKDTVAPVKEKETTGKPAPIMVLTRPDEEPVARSYNPGEVRSKRSRSDK